MVRYGLSQSAVAGRLNRKFALALLCSLLLLTLGASQSLAVGSPEAQRVASQAEAKIEPLVLEEIAELGETDFFIRMVEKADLSPAAAMPTKEDKGAFVFEALRSTAERTQRDLRAYLDSQGADYQAFYIANRILVRQGNAGLLNAVAARPDVAAVTANRHFQLEEPSIGSGLGPRSVGPIEPNITFVRAPEVWAMGYTGQGTVVAANDTGMDWDHPALINHYRGWNGSTVDHNYNWWDATNTYPNEPNDGAWGHGTSVSGVMVGDDGSARQIGVAPGAELIHCKAATDAGGVLAAAAIECFQWDLAPWDLSGSNPDPSKAPDAVNNSWGHPGGTQSFVEEIDALVAAGIAVEAGAGNSGPNCASLGSPGDYSQVISAGSVDHAGGVLPGTLTWFSSRGPSSLHPDIPKPDVLAPGQNIDSSMPGGVYSGPYWNGTSLSGPHVVGLMGLMWSANPALRGNVAETYDIIFDTAVRLTGQTGNNCGGDYVDGPNNDWGYGTMDAVLAVEDAIYGGGPNFALYADPHLREVCATDSTFYSLTLRQIDGFTEEVTLDTANVPPGYSTGFSTNPVMPPATAAVILTEDGTAAAGSYEITISGQAQSNGREIEVALDVYSETPSAPDLLSPADGETEIPLTPTFEWAGATQGLTYTIQVATDPTFANVVESASLRASSHESSVMLEPLTTYYWRLLPANPCGTGSQSTTFAFTTRERAPILLVDDDNDWPDVRDYYLDTLTAIEAPADVWVTRGTDEEPTYSDLALYDAVIWFTGYSRWGLAGPGADGEVALAEWLDEGGCFLISSTFYHFNRNLTPFMDAYLGVQWAFDRRVFTQVTGQGSVYGDLGPYTPQYFFPNYNTNLVVDADAEIAWTSDLGAAAVDKDAGTYRTTYWGFPFEALPDQDARTAAMEATLNWCAGLPQAGVTLSGPQAASGSAGSSVAYDFTITNAGTVSDTFDLAVSGNAWSAAVEPPTLDLDPGESAPVELTVSIPTTAGAGETDEATLTATSQYEPAVTDSTTATTTVAEAARLYLPAIQRAAEAEANAPLALAAAVVPLLAGLGGLRYRNRRR